MVGPRGGPFSYERGNPVGYRVSGSRLDVYEAEQGQELVFGFRVQGFGFWVLGFRYGFRVRGVVRRV